MEISLYTVAAYNIINIIIIVIFGTRLIIKSYEEIVEEKIVYDLKGDVKKYSTYNLFVTHLNHIRKKFWLNFYMLEAGLFAYFIFWGILFYNNVKIVF